MIVNLIKAIVSSALKENTILYHGCSNIECFKGIRKNGLLPRVTKETRGKNGKYVPMVDSVYLTKNIAYAMIYAFNGNMVGHDLLKEELENIKKNKNERYGYIFVFDSDSLSDIVKPDEDEVGHLFYCKVTNHDYHSERNDLVIENKDIPEFIVDIARSYAAENTYKKAVRYDDYGDLCRIGKLIIKHMTDEQKKYLANLVNNISIIGNAYPIHCYRVDKLDRVKYDANGNNFFELAKQIF